MSQGQGTRQRSNQRSLAFRELLLLSWKELERGSPSLLPTSSSPSVAKNETCPYLSVGEALGLNELCVVLETFYSEVSCYLIPLLGIPFLEKVFRSDASELPSL